MIGSRGKVKTIRSSLIYYLIISLLLGSYILIFLKIVDGISVLLNHSNKIFGVPLKFAPRLQAPLPTHLPDMALHTRTKRVNAERNTI